MPMNGSDGDRQALGQRPEHRHAARVDRSKTATTTVAATTAIKMAGMRGRRFKNRINSERAGTDRERRDVGVSREQPL